MSRPTDWDAIGLQSDPTPGDPVRLHTVADSLAGLGKTARDIDSAMETVLNKTGRDAFAGETADELRHQIGDRLRGFVQSIADAFEWSSSALRTYADAMSSAQSQADSALDQGRGLAKDDPNRDTLATTAKTAGSTLSEAARTATTTVRKASNHIKSPISPCAEFWQIFQWIAIALIIPALIFGGPVALVAIAVNLTLFIKTAVDFAQGKASGLDLFLSALGMIAPTTRGLPVLSLLSKGFQLVKSGIKAGSIAALDIFKGMLTGLTKPFVLLPSLHDLVLATGSWTKAGGLWISNVTRVTGQLGLNIIKSGSLFVVNGLKGVPAFVQGIGPALGTFGKASADWFRGEFGGAKWLRIILPAEGDEIGAFGVAKAMKIALIDRGLFGKFRFGAVQPTVQAFGAGASHIPTPGAFTAPEAFRNVNPLVDTPLTGLADTRIQVDQWTGTLGSVTPPRISADPGRIAGAGLYLPSPPTLTIGTQFGEAINFSLQATTRMDALLDMPIRELSSMKLGEWANITHTPDGFTAETGVSALPAPVADMLSPPPVHVDVTHIAAQAGTPSPGIAQIPTDIASAGVVARATDLVMPSPAPVVHATTPPVEPGVVTAPPLTTAHAVSPGSLAPALPGAPNLTAVHALAPTPNAEFTGTIANIADGQNMATIARHTSLDLGPVLNLGHTPENLTPPPTTAHSIDLSTGGVISAPPPPTSLVTPPPATPHTVDVRTGSVDQTVVTPATPPPTSLVTPPPTSAAGTAPPPSPGLGNGLTAHLPALTAATPDLAGKAGLSGAATTAAPSSTRIDAVMNLLDDGALGRKIPTPDPVGGNAVDGPTVSGSAPAGLGDKAFAGAPAHASPPSPAPTAVSAPPRIGPAPRLTGKELDRAWTAHDERIGALFGAADDPLRSQRFDAWAEFVHARYDLARGQEHLDYLHSFPGEPSSGVSPAITHTENGLNAVQQRFDTALRGLREQGINPVALDQAITDIDRQSVLDRPRLLGGALPMIRVEGADQGRLVEVVPLSDAAGRPQGMSVHITYRPDGVDVRVDTADEPNGSGAFDASVGDDGRLVIHDVQTGFDRHFDSAGVFESETIPLRGADGGLLGDGVVVRYGPDGVTGHGLVSADPSPRTVTPTADDGFRVDRPGGEGTGATYQLFDQRGLHLWDGHRIHVGGSDMGSVEFPAPGRTDTARWLDPNGDPVPGSTVTRETDAAGNPTGIKVINDADGDFIRHDITTGDATESGTPLRGGDGALDGRFAVIPTEGTDAGHVENLAGNTLPGQVLDHPGGGIRIHNDAGDGRPITYERFDGNNVHVSDGRQLFDQNGNTAGFADIPLGDQVGRLLNTEWQDVPGVRIDPGAGGAGTIRVTDTTTGGYRTFDVQTGHLGDHAVMLKGTDGPLDRFGVTRYPAPGAENPAPEHLGLDANGARLDDLTFHGEDGWRLTPQNVGVQAGEYRQFDLGGRLTGQRVNVIENGRLVPGRHFEISFTPNGGTWRLFNDNGTAAPGLLHSGKVDIVSDAGRIRLVAKPGTTSVEIFDRRPLPGGGFVDTVRRTDVNGFGRWTGGQRPKWTQYTADGTVTNWGVRKFGTLDGKAWKDVDRFNAAAHEFRQGINGTVFAHKTGDGWSWTRFDKKDHVPVASGSRTYDIDGGWTDRLGDGTGPVVQRQWGPAHLPQNNAGHYQEVALDANGAPKTVTINRDGQTITEYLWNEQSEHGKPTGALEQLPGGSILETHRWSEQRPPQWVRRGLMGIGDQVWDAHPHLKNDTRYQMSTWTQTDLATGAETHGFRFTSMNDGTLDIAADGGIVRSTMKLNNGNTLKVGDSVRLPAGVTPDPRFKPWSEGPGKLSGHRAHIDNAPDGRIWEDRFDPAAGDGNWYHPQDNIDWQVARIGYADGTVREFRVGPGKIVDENVWVAKDPHGAIIGRSDLWPAGGQTPHRIEMTAPTDTRWNFTGYNGRADAQSWYWTDHGAVGGAPRTGPARNMRGYNGATPFDDSFIHFERGGQGIEAVRIRNVLGGGQYVDSWRVTAADGTHTWQWAKYDKTGAMVDYPGTHTRQWWDPRMNDGRGGWTNDWSTGVTRFQDLLTPPRPNADAIVVREIPPTAVNGRIREFLSQGDVRPPAGTWQEFDHGGVVRQRTPLPDGGFLETDAWLGQWRRYDNAGNIVAQRTSSGFVFETNNANRLQLTGRELDFRGPLTELRGWGRRIREANRLEWKFSPPGAPRLGEAVYQPQWRLIANKAAIEFFQDFILEFTANLAVNAIVAGIQGQPFTGKDALKAFANASVGSGIKTGVGTLVHENRIAGLRHTGDWRMGLANVDGGKLWNRHPLNHDKHWSNEWAGNETPTRWRGGTYDFSYNAGVSILSGWVNGSMNASVFGFSDANGNTVTVKGGTAALDGLINAASSAAGAISTGLGKNLYVYTMGSRSFHRQGFGEFVTQFAFKLPEKLTTWKFTNLFRGDLNPPWYQSNTGQPPGNGGAGGPQA